MTITLGVVFLVVGLATSSWSAVAETRAAGRQRIPLWGIDREPGQPRFHLVVRLVAAVLVLTGAVLLLIVWEPAAILLVVSVVLPQAIVVALHNRRVRTWQLARAQAKRRRDDATR